MSNVTVMRDGVEISVDVATVFPVVAVGVPTSITNFQFRAALRAANKAAAFKTYFNSLTEDAQEEWQFRPTIERGSAMVAAAATALSVNSTQLDNLFRAAGVL